MPPVRDEAGQETFNDFFNNRSMAKTPKKEQARTEMNCAAQNQPSRHACSLGFI
jgi:hypothetical protein